MERFTIRTEGGPSPGTFFPTLASWPLPDILTVDTPEAGHYQKVAESAYPPQDPDTQPRVLRGAVYRWVPDVQGEALDASSDGYDGAGLTPEQQEDADDEWVVGQEI